MKKIAEVEKHRFIKFYDVLLEHEELLKLSFHARGLYCILFDRLQLAKRYPEHYQDKDGEFFVEVTADIMCQWLSVSKPTLNKIKKELVDVGLLVEKKGGYNKPNHLYPKSITSVINLRGTSEEVFDGKHESQMGVVLESTRDHGDKLFGDEEGVKNLYGVKKLYTGGKKSLRLGLKNFTLGRKNSLRYGVKKLYPNQTIYQTYKQTTVSRSVGQYYQERIGVLDGIQFEQLMDFVKLDGMNEEVICLGIDLAADKGKRSFKYLLGILRNWKQDGIKTVGDVKARQTERQAKKSYRSNIPSWSNPDYKGKTYDEMIAELEGVDDEPGAF
ncbi:DnaD domain protein [Streptococcus sp. sy010]|uniref:DnaD domain protein n=1 Tax=Streptococcus sp. sy010 TaxID=2600148 RepID=UPI0011B42C91|nr:DnaD domain protein [Streptococcus sp. sy010]TWT16431.1 DnaD domain protein [Streptococcus sp. sy010]